MGKTTYTEGFHCKSDVHISPSLGCKVKVNGGCLFFSGISIGKIPFVSDAEVSNVMKNLLSLHSSTSCFQEATTHHYVLKIPNHQIRNHLTSGT